MPIEYNYICKKCWKQWKIGYKVLACPKCGSSDIDYEYNVTGG